MTPRLVRDPASEKGTAQNREWQKTLPGTGNTAAFGFHEAIPMYRPFINGHTALKVFSLTGY